MLAAGPDVVAIWENPNYDMSVLAPVNSVRRLPCLLHECGASALPGWWRCAERAAVQSPLAGSVGAICTR